MKQLLLVCAVAGFSADSLVASGRISIDATFIEGKARSALPHNLKTLSTRKGATVLVSPRALARSGQSAQIEIKNEFRASSVAPTQHPLIPTGVVLRVTPHAIKGGFAYTAYISVRTLDSVTDIGAPPVSTFTTREIYASGTPKSGEEVWLDLPARDGKAIAVRLVFKSEA